MLMQRYNKAEGSKLANKKKGKKTRDSIFGPLLSINYVILTYDCVDTVMVVV